MRSRSAADASATPAEAPARAPRRGALGHGGQSDDGQRDDGRGGDAPGETDRGPSASELSDRDRRILALESRTFRFVGAKERRIREELGMTPTAYFVRLNTLLDEPAALREAPALVHRLRGLRTRGDEHRPGPAHAA